MAVDLNSASDVVHIISSHRMLGYHIPTRHTDTKSRAKSIFHPLTNLYIIITRSNALFPDEVRLKLKVDIKLEPIFANLYRFHPLKIVDRSDETQLLNIMYNLYIYHQPLKLSRRIKYTEYVTIMTLIVSFYIILLYLFYQTIFIQLGVGIAPTNHCQDELK